MKKLIRRERKRHHMVDQIPTRNGSAERTIRSICVGILYRDKIDPGKAIRQSAYGISNVKRKELAKLEARTTETCTNIQVPATHRAERAEV